MRKIILQKMKKTVFLTEGMVYPSVDVVSEPRRHPLTEDLEELESLGHPLVQAPPARSCGEYGNPVPRPFLNPL